MSPLFMQTNLITMRKSTAADEPLLFELFAENKAREFASLGTGDHLRPLLEMQYRARCSGYRETFPAAVQHIVLDEGGRPVGHALLSEKHSEHRVVDLAIRGCERGKGFGSAVLQAVQSRAASAGKPLRLQVLPSSPARRLYERLGFGAMTEAALACEMSWSAANQLEMSEA